MKKVLLVVAVLVAVAGISVVATAQVKKGKTRAASTKQLMSGIVQVNCAALGKGTKDAPTDDKGWAALATNAALLNEAGYLLMDDGRCPDGDWAGAAKAMQTGSAAVLAKIEAKDLEGAAAEFKKVTESCAACHKVHKK
jgi:cytochrome c556